MTEAKRPIAVKRKSERLLFRKREKGRGKPGKGKGERKERGQVLHSHIIAMQVATPSPRATVRVYGKRAEELGKKRRGRENEGRAMAR